MRPPTAQPRKPHDNVAAWLAQPEVQEYFGPAFRLRFDVLAAIVKGRDLAAVAREHNVTPEAVYKRARRVKALFFRSTES